MTILEEIGAEIRACTRCALSRSRSIAVPGEGRDDADIMFVGEAPGQQEDRQGRPFVGPAGQFLNELLTDAGLRREQVFITNIVKCRPPGNREPLPVEIEACRDYLIGQIAAIQPTAICTLGSPALRTLVDPKLSITRVHGSRLERGGIVYVPLYHPAAAIHKPTLRQTIVDDFVRLRSLLART